MRAGGTLKARDFGFFGRDDPDLLVKEGKRFPRGVMVLLAVSKTGAGRLIFPPDGGKNLRRRDLRLSGKEVAPDIEFRTKARGDPSKWIWQQGLAPARAKKSVLSEREPGKLVLKNLPRPPKGGGR